ncbi:unnamed protein product [Cylindrotheca closterium]|uniref:Uncharacterized protein n=1 Tax=Cylindrotheca closterium TaxID=2856 RepID=A0AAD2CCK3_9STRA|nr:unnamed protein product [Cylindrotheca closterium]
MYHLSPLSTSIQNRYHNTLRLYPWRDGYEFTRKLLQQESYHDSGGDHHSTIQAILVSFSEHGFQEYLQDADAITLFEEIGSNSQVESVTIELDVFSELPTSVAIPPILAVTSLLTAHNNRIRHLCLRKLQLSSHKEDDDLDVNGMVEALRIHPTLQSIEVKHCTFSKQCHLQRLRSTLTGRKGIKHCDLFDNRVSFTKKEEGEGKIDYKQEYEPCSCSQSWRSSCVPFKNHQFLWARMLCLFCFSSVSVLLMARLFLSQEEPILWNHLMPFASSTTPLSSSSSNRKLLQPEQEMPDINSYPLLSIMPWQILPKDKKSKRRKTKLQKSSNTCKPYEFS